MGQFDTAPPFIVRTPVPNSMLRSFGRFRTVPATTSAGPCSESAWSLEQPSNAPAQTFVTEAGIERDVRFVQLAKAPALMLDIELGIKRLVSPPQPQNAPSPIDVTGLPSISRGMTTRPSVSEGMAHWTSSR